VGQVAEEWFGVELVVGLRGHEPSFCNIIGAGYWF
jgi:hypothetical protein